MPRLTRKQPTDHEAERDLNRESELPVRGEASSPAKAREEHHEETAQEKLKHWRPMFF